MSALLRYDAACRALAEAKTVDEVAEWSDKAAAVREYARRINNRSLELDAAEIKERAERRRGELLLELKAAGALAEGRKKTIVGAREFPDRVTLKDLNTSPDESSRAQRVAAIPPWQFEKLLVASRQELEEDPRRHAIDVLRERDGPVNGARTVMASRQEPDDSLDYFPTPPYATRALFERVLVHMGVRSVDQVWEPACGEGHMTAVIEEYAKGTVVGTDIFDYSREGRMPPAWWRTLDFLDPAETTPVTDWIITNPPFGDKTESFVLRALDLAEVGVAMFVRLQWLETISRYEAIFRDRPPTLIAFFCERVNLCKGRWEPDGSTATAYIWLVWMRDHMPMAPFWIPPGCRKDLSRETDRERFTAHPVACPPREALNGGIPPSPDESATATPPRTASAPPPGPGVAEAAPRLSPAPLADGAASKPFDEGPELPAILDRRGLLAPAQRAALASAFPPSNDEVKPCP